jgi:glycerol uptake facilitator-like aquaporin
MESSVPENHKYLHLIRSLLYEFVGTWIVVYAFNFSANNYWERSFAYFTMWMLCFTVSGAHFNPAFTLGVYLAEGKYLKQLLRLILYWLFQVMGAYAGILTTYLIFNEPVEGYLLWPNERIPGGVGATRYFS